MLITEWARTCPREGMRIAQPQASALLSGQHGSLRLTTHIQGPLLYAEFE
jgi:hypothetical protein